MRWIRPTHKAIRIVKRFALFPISVLKSRETRWFEWCYIIQQYSIYYAEWDNIDFTTEKEYEEFKNKLMEDK